MVLLIFPDSLSCRISQTSYYLTTNVLYAKLESKPSYIWRSISQALPLLHKGLLLRVVDNSQITIWQDRWLPFAVSCKILSAISVLPVDAKVMELLDAQGGW